VLGGGARRSKNQRADHTCLDAVQAAVCYAAAEGRSFKLTGGVEWPACLPAEPELGRAQGQTGAAYGWRAAVQAAAGWYRAGQGRSH
jgi:hypothetical protein